MSVQQKCSKIDPPDVSDKLVEHFDELIEDMLADDWGHMSAQEAVDLLDILHAVRQARIRRYGEDDPRANLVLPLAIEARILEVARSGKGRGVRKRNAILHEFEKQLIFAVGNDKKVALKGVRANLAIGAHDSAEDMAVKHAKKAAEETGMRLKSGYIRREMQKWR